MFNFIILFTMMMKMALTINIGQTINQIEQFCFDDSHHIKAMFMMGDYLVFRMNTETLYGLYHWKNGHLLSSVWHQQDIFVNVSAQHYNLDYLTTMDLCQLFTLVSPSVNQQTRHNGPIFNDNIVHSLASDLQKMIIDPDPMKGVNDVNSHQFRQVSLSKEPYVDDKGHGDIKTQLEMFEARLRTFSDRLIQPSPRLTSKQSSCGGQLIVATFCHSQRSFENDICHDSVSQTDQQKCWPKTMFFQYITSDDPAHPFRLLPIPFKYSLISNLLSLRGLFQMSDPRRFVQISSRLRCHNDQAVMARTLMNVIDLHRDDLISGFHLDQFDFLQSRTIPGHLDYLDSTKISMAEFFNCFGNSSAIRLPLALQYDHRQSQLIADQIVKVTSTTADPTYESPIVNNLIVKSHSRRQSKRKIKFHSTTTQSTEITTSEFSQFNQRKKRRSSTSTEINHKKEIEQFWSMATIKTTTTYISSDNKKRFDQNWWREYNSFDMESEEKPETTTYDDYAETETDISTKINWYQQFQNNNRSKLFIIILIIILVIAGCLMRLGRSEAKEKDVFFHRKKSRKHPSIRKNKSKSFSKKRSHRRASRLTQIKQNVQIDDPLKMDHNDHNDIIVIDVEKIQQSNMLDLTLTNRIQTMVDESRIITKMMNQPYKAIYDTVSSIRMSPKPEESPPSSATIRSLLSESPPLEPMIEAGDDERIHFNNSLKPAINDPIYGDIDDNNVKMMYILHRLAKSLHAS